MVGKGRFKQIYKAFDTQIGIDVAWSKISAEPHHLSDEQLQNIVSEMTKGLDLEHPNIIKCFECWEDEQRHCINLITELFTSGNLRQYRNLHKHLDLKVRWAATCDRGRTAAAAGGSTARRAHCSGQPRSRRIAWAARCSALVHQQLLALCRGPGVPVCLCVVPLSLLRCP